MARYTITCACGCKYTYNICGKVATRQERAAWLATQDCPACRAKARRAAAAEKIADADLPKLSGVSEKQIAYANDVRAQLLADIHARENELVQEIVEAFEDCSESCARRALREELDYIVANATEARGWLDNRNYFASRLLEAAIDRAADMDDDDDDNGAGTTAPEPTVAPVEVNSADASALRTIRGVGRVLAARIVAFVASLGRALETLDELLAVRGIGLKTLEKIRVAATC